MEDFELEAYRKAGKINKIVKEYAKMIILPGMKLVEIANLIEEKILELEADIAFPVNLAVDEVAAHYTPHLEDDTLAEGLLKVDIGVEIEGFIADSAFSLDLTKDKRYIEMILENERVLNEALSKLEVGSKASVIGNTIQDELKGSKFKIVHNLAGHSLDRDEIHSGLSISNHQNNNSAELYDCAVAIEPFLTTGRGEIYEGAPSGIYLLQGDGNPRDKDVRVLLNFIRETYRTKPFCKRWLQKEGFPKLNFSLKVLEQEGILHNFPVLIEKDKKPVSQAEHTVIFDKFVEITTK